MASTAAYGNNGAFLIPGPDHGKLLQVIVSDGAGWEHVSVATKSRVPTWDEMCFVKALFWTDEECGRCSSFCTFHLYVLYLPVNCERLNVMACSITFNN